ncbi:MAG: hypothetical protein ACI9U2_004783 [Bradymonadia bacterium]|jgi:hypothetical protein
MTQQSRRALARLIGLLGLVCLGACSKDKETAAAAPSTQAPPPALVVSRLRVIDETPPAHRPVTLPLAALEAPWKAALTAQGFTFTASADAVAVRLDARVVYGLTTGEGLLDAVGPGQAEVRWAIKVKLRPPGSAVDDYAFVEGHAGAPFDGDAAALATALRAQIESAVAQPAADIKARALLMTLTPTHLVTRLKSPDARIRLAAVDRLGALRATLAVPALVELSKTEKERIVLLRVIGALSEIGDDDAAKALISLANLRDREMLRAVVNALSVVGGARVSDFLDILSVHDADDVREMVDIARARLARKSRKDVE